jgi:hypothetical protein
MIVKMTSDVITILKVPAGYVEYFGGLQAEGDFPYLRVIKQNERTMKTKKEIITEIENVFRKDPNKEIDVKNTGVSFVNKRYGLCGTILCLVEGTVMVRLNKDSNVYWKANLNEKKKEELVSLTACMGKD